MIELSGLLGLIYSRLGDKKLKRVDTGAYETAQTGVEYYSPVQQGRIYGIVYRQYFLTSLPGNLTSGNNVSALMDYIIQFVSEGTNVRNIAHGHTTAVEGSDKRCSIWLTGASGNNNLIIDKEGTGDDYEPIRGWVDYTK